MTWHLHLRCRQLDEARLGDLKKLVNAALVAVDPATAVRRHLGADDLRCDGRVVVVAAGKAALPMATAVLDRLGDRPVTGVVVVPETSGAPDTLGPLPVLVSAHPAPDARSELAAQAVSQVARGLTTQDLFVLALSGGASSLLSAPRPGLTLDNIIELNRQLLASGATIAEINCVRRHVLALAGGHLARLAAPARCLGLLLSDVVGDDPTVIGSGPLSAVATAWTEALGVLDRYDLRRRLPVIARFLEQAFSAQLEDNLPADLPWLERVACRLVGSGTQAAQATCAAAGDLGYGAEVESEPLIGDVAFAAARLAKTLVDLRRHTPPGHQALRLLAGETTVKIAGHGRGGRNQELALRAATSIAGLADAAILTLATDGVDGPTDAAGGLVDGHTMARAGQLGIDVAAHLANNDAYPVLDALGCLLRTGPTQTNVADLAMLVCW